MRLTNFSLTNFRNFARLDVEVPPGVILIQGRNAQGKTSILEAVYFLSALASFHAQSDRELVNFIEARSPLAVARIVAGFERTERSHRLEVRIIQERVRNGAVRVRKEALLDGVKMRLGEIVGQFNAVLFLPQMMRIVEGSPSERRRYLDMTLSQVIPHYAVTLGEYIKVLAKRNALLKQLNEYGGDRDQLDFWDERIALRGAEIVHQRIQAVQELDRIVGIIHHRLTRGEEVLRLDYRPAFDPLPPPDHQMALLDTAVDRSGVALKKIESGLLEALRARRAEEIKRAMTTLGPHRDDLRFLSNGLDLGIYGSRGQVRTTMLGLKMAELDWVKERTGHQPILLLDEVLAELDQERRADLLARVAESQQTLMTTTDLGLFNPGFLEKVKVWDIADGRLIQQG